MGVITRGQTRIENEPIMDRFKLNVPTLHLDYDRRRRRHDPQGRSADRARSSLGPESAGADPGPICFDRGGTEPTIADCDAILGRLNPDYFLGGKVELDVDKATRVFKEKCADRAGRRRQEAAEGMIDMLEAGRQQRAAPRHLGPGHPPVGVHASLLWRLGTAASCRLQPGHRLQRHPHLPVRRRLLRLRLHHRRFHAPPFGVDADRYSDRGR